MNALGRLMRFRAIVIAASCLGSMVIPSSANESMNSSTLVQGDVAIRLTLADAVSIRAAILTALRRSAIEGRDELVAISEPLPARIDADGRVTAGGWLLELRKGRLVATYRRMQTESRIIGLVAPVTRSGSAWYVDEIREEEVLLRR